MDIEHYQKFVNKTAFFPKSSQGRNLSYLVMGIVEEVGEIFEFIVKKETLNETEYILEQIIKESGDLLWYITAICNEINFSLERLMQYAKVKKNKHISNSSLLIYLGNLSGAVKKMIRDDNEKITDKKSDLIINNLCYILMFVLQLCDENNVKFKVVLEINAKKIKDRQKRGTLKGSGNDR
jgi:NTP pyrophosphatase (non-canonical NTP hydrolase)